MDEGASNSRRRAIALVREALQIVSRETPAQARPSARRAMEWRLLSEERPRAFVEQSPVSVSIYQLDETSFADLCCEIQAMSEAVLDEVVGLQPQAEAEGERGGEALGPLGGRVDER
jgi:hypothetical protein